MIRATLGRGFRPECYLLLLHSKHDGAATQVVTLIQMLRLERSKKWVNEVTTQILAYLEIQALAWKHQHNPKAPYPPFRLFRDILNNMPLRFDEAASVLSLLYLRATHSPLDLPRGSTIFSIISGYSPPVTNTTSDPESSYSQLCVILGQFQQWNTAFKPLLKTARQTNAEEKLFKGATLLRLHYLASYI